MNLSKKVVLVVAGLCNQCVFASELASSSLSGTDSDDKNTMVHVLVVQEQIVLRPSNDSLDDVQADVIAALYETLKIKTYDDSCKSGCKKGDVPLFLGWLLVQQDSYYTSNWNDSTYDLLTEVYTRELNYSLNNAFTQSTAVYDCEQKFTEAMHDSFKLLQVIFHGAGKAFHPPEKIRNNLLMHSWKFYNDISLKRADFVKSNIKRNSKNAEVLEMFARQAAFLQDLKELLPPLPDMKNIPTADPDNLDDE